MPTDRIERVSRIPLQGLAAVAIALLTSTPTSAQQVDLMSRAAVPAASAGLSQLVPQVGESQSQDGRFAVFLSAAINVVAGQVDLNTGNDVFLFDRVTGGVGLVSRAASSASTTGNGTCSSAVISGDGAFVAFQCEASNIVPGDPGNLFLLERATGAVTVIGLASTFESNISISADGRYVGWKEVAFLVSLFDRTAGSSTLVSQGRAPRVSADGNYVVYLDLNATNAYLFERASGSITLVTHAAGSPTAPASGSTCSMSDVTVSSDGSRVSYVSCAVDLVAEQVDGSASPDVFLFDRATGTNTLVSHFAGASPPTAVGQCGNGAAISGDGRYVAFTSYADSLVQGQIKPSPYRNDVYLYDRTTGESTLVSHIANSPTASANGDSWYPAISGDGAFVAFTSSAADLGQGGETGADSFDVFLFDRATGAVTIASHVAGQPTAAANGTYPNAVSISGGGGYVLFASRATTLVDGLVSANRPDDLFLYERTSGTNRLVSRAGQPSATGNGESATKVFSPGSILAPASLSADGRYAVFTSKATNLVAGQSDDNGFADAFLYDRGSGQVVLVSRAAGSLATGAASHDDVRFAAISPDGNSVLFTSDAANLVPGQIDENGSFDLFLFERATGATTLVTHAPGLPTTTGSLCHPFLCHAVTSDDGALVAFSKIDVNQTVYTFERASGVISLVSADAARFALSGDGNWVAIGRFSSGTLSLFERTTGNVTPVATDVNTPPALSSDGRYMAFVSYAPDLIPGQDDQLYTPDVFLFDRVAGTTSLVSHAVGSSLTAVGDANGELALSHDGNYLAFVSTSSSLVAGTDTAGTQDVFLFDRATGTNTLVSHVAAPAVDAAGGDSPSISADGSVVAFQSAGTNLVAGQTNDNPGYDVFLFERTTGITTLASRVSPNTRTGDGESRDPVLSRSGSHVAFRSAASNLTANDYNGADDAFIFGTCSAPPTISVEPSDQSVAIGDRATFQVVALDAGGYQWQRDGVDIPGATGPYYTTPPIAAADSGSTYRCQVRGACSAQTATRAARLTIADAEPPVVSVVSPSGGEYWLLSSGQTVSWTMSDNVRVCAVRASLMYSNDAGGSYQSPADGGVLAVFDNGVGCPYPGETRSNVPYVVPAAFPSGVSGSLYKVEVSVTDQAGLVTTVRSPNPFYIVRPNPDSVRTLILANVARMQDALVMGSGAISAAQASALASKLQELSNHPNVQGVVVDLAGVTSLGPLYAAWDAAATPAESSSRANDLLFAVGGIHDVLRNRLQAYTGGKYVVVVGDDRVIPLARMPDRTGLSEESVYTAGGDLTPTGSPAGRALSVDKYLSDDPLGSVDLVRPSDLATTLFVPDLAVGRLVETPQEITKTIATFIGQSGALDLEAASHKVLVTGYDFLSDSATRIGERWTTKYPAAGAVDATLIGQSWVEDDLRQKLCGNGGSRYGLASISGHATHYDEGVPGEAFGAGLTTEALLDPNLCGANQPLDLAGSVIYAVGCHSGLPVPGSNPNDPDHSLDLPQMFLSRGAVAYVGNTGFGWGLKQGEGYSERLVRLLTTVLARGGTVKVGDAVREAKLSYYLNKGDLDDYDQKVLMEWTLYGLPMYEVRTAQPAGGVTEGSPFVGSRPTGTGESEVGVTAEVAEPAVAPLPSFLTQLNLHFDFTAAGVYRKLKSDGTEETQTTGCSHPNGCYYTLNDLSTGAAEVPIQPYFVYDSRLSGTSQHGVLWKGGEYDEETGWKAIFGQLVTNSVDGSNSGNTPRKVMIHATAPRLVPGAEPPGCQASDLEVNSLVVGAGELLKDDQTDQYTIERHYRGIDLEVFYFNNTVDGAGNCDRTGPVIGPEPYHTVTGSTIHWAIPVTDGSGVWRVIVVVNDNATQGGRGRWVPVELSFDGANWVGSQTVGSGQATYVVEAVDIHGNVTWSEYPVGATASGVSPRIPNPVEVTLDSGSAPLLSIGDATVVEGNAGTQAVLLSVTLSQPSGQTVRVGYTTANGTATAGLDYIAASGEVVFPPGSVVQPLLVSVSGDVLVEGNETFAVDLSNPVSALIGDGQGVVTILDDEGNSSQLSIDDVVVTEPESGSTNVFFTVRLTPPTGQVVSVTYATQAGTAAGGSDYLTRTGTLTFQPGETERYLAVPVLADAVLESTETFFVNLNNPTNASISKARGEGWILDGSSGRRFQFGLPSYSVGEAGVKATVTVLRTGPTGGTVTVDYEASDGTATVGSDYTATTGTLVFGPGIVSKAFTVPITNDTVVEGPETVLLSLSNPTSAALGSPSTAVLTIVDNDIGGTIELSSATYSVGESGPLATIAVKRSLGTASGVTVEYGTSDGTATAGSDYTAASGILSFGAGMTTQTFTVEIQEDVLTEGDETLNLTLSGPTGGATLGPKSLAKLTILENESTVQFTSANYTVKEGTATAVITVKRSGPTAGTATVGYATSDGTALAGSDYTGTSGTLTFGAGIVTRTFAVPITNDTVQEGDEAVLLSLANPTGGPVLGQQSTAVLTIQDNDPGGTIQFSLSGYSVSETMLTATITVTRTLGTASNVTVDFATSDGTAADGTNYTGTTGTLTFAAGQTSRTFTVGILDDGLIDSDKTVNLALSNPTGGAGLGSRSTALLTIRTADPVVQFSAASYVVKEGTPTATITVKRSGPTAGTVMVDFGTSDGTATAGQDYTTTAGTLTFGPGVTVKTFTVPITNDPDVEGDETVDLALSSPDGAAIGPKGTAVLTILTDNTSFQFGASTYTVTESAPAATITVSRSAPLAGMASVAFATSDGTAHEGTDYTATSGTLTFGPSVGSRTFPVKILNDTVHEGNETVDLALSNPSPGTVLGARDMATLTIASNDAAGVVQFSVSNYSVSETGPTATITVTRTGGTASGVTIDYATSDGTAIAGTNYLATSGTLIFGDGETNKTLTVPVLDDLITTGNQTVALTLSNPTGGATLGARGTATLWIVENQ